jgi:uncharacterized protein (DUF58 family)
MSLLPPPVLRRLERLRISPRHRRSNRAIGSHLTGRGGSSMEFADYRDYSAGDDTRFIDWNIYSRLRRPYIKLYHLEEALHVQVLVDSSASMAHGGKLTMAQQLAAAFSVMALRSGERLSIVADRPMLTPSTGITAIPKAMQAIAEIAAGGAEPIEAGIERALRRHRGKGVAVLLSDFFSCGPLERACNVLHHAGLEIYALQILAPDEISPALSGDWRLEDCETGALVDVDSVETLDAIYQDHFQRLQAEVGALCRQRHGRHMLIDSSTPLTSVLFDRLLRQGWLR